MKVRSKVAVVGAVLGIAMVGGASSASALTLYTPNGQAVTAPEAAVPGAANAFTQVNGKVGSDHPLTLG